MRICLLTSEHGPYGGLGIAIACLGRALAREHEVTLIHPYEDTVATSGFEDAGSLRQVVVDPSRLPQIAFACDGQARAAAILLALEEAYGDEPPDYVEVPEYQGLGLVLQQARDGGHRSLRGTSIAVRLTGMAELICLQDGTYPRPRHRIVFDMERESLRLADAILWPGGDVLEAYRRSIDSVDFGQARRVRLPRRHRGAAPSPAPRPAGEPLRILYAGRLQKVKGVPELVEACLRLDARDWRLSLAGGDTETAPLAQSVRTVIELMSAGEERIAVLGQLSRDELQECFEEHDLLVLPSRHDVWPNVALEGMRAGLPILATPVDGFTELVADGVTGWHTAGTGTAAIRDSLERLLADREEVERVRASGEIFRRFERLTDEDRVLGEYRDLFGALRPVAPARPAAQAPSVTGIVPYFGDHETVAEAVDSLLGQSHRELEVLIVNDGSFAPEDGVLDELAGRERVRVLAKPNGGECGARNLGALLSDSPYLAFLDADNVLEPDFVARAVAMLERDPELAYVTPWLRFFGDGDGAFERVGLGGYAPLGNGVRSDDAINSDGDAIAVMPRRLFSQLGFRYEESAAMLGDWEFYRRLRDAGRYGAVIPELLGRYRVRGGSLSRSFSGAAHAQAWDEALSRRRRGRTPRAVIA